MAKLLQKLLVEPTKSRSCHYNDNALAECKHAIVVREHMGYSHIPQKSAQPINAFLERGVQPVAESAPPLHVCQRHRQP